MEVGDAILRSNSYVIEELKTGAPPPVPTLSISPSTWSTDPNFKINWSTPIWSEQRDLLGAIIDISDGILQDLSHLISSSGVGCNINLDKVPVVDKKLKKQCLEFGDDYQILYTVAPRRLKALKVNLKSAGKECHTIGVMGGKKLNITNNIDFIRNWDHFN